MIYVFYITIILCILFGVLAACLFYYYQIPHLRLELKQIKAINSSESVVKTKQNNSTNNLRSLSQNIAASESLSDIPTATNFAEALAGETEILVPMAYKMNQSKYNHVKHDQDTAFSNDETNILIEKKNKTDDSTDVLMPIQTDDKTDVLKPHYTVNSKPKKEDFLPKNDLTMTLHDLETSDQNSLDRTSKDNQTIIMTEPMAKNDDNNMTQVLNTIVSTNKKDKSDSVTDVLSTENIKLNTANISHHTPKNSTADVHNTQNDEETMALTHSFNQNHITNDTDTEVLVPSDKTNEY